MNYFAPGKYRVRLRCALTLTAIFAAAGGYAQSLRVTAANSSSPNAVYDVLFSPPAQTTLLNGDGSAFKSFHSLVFVPNTTSGGADLLVADTAGGSIVRYFGPTGTPPVSSTLVWSSASAIPGPLQPDGLSVDAKGNLYVVATGNNGAKPQLWVLPAAPITPSTPTGYLAPVLLDQFFNGNEVDSLVETLVVPEPTTAAAQIALTNAGIGVGDLLVLVADNDFLTGDGGKRDRNEPELVYDYAASDIQKVINGTAKSLFPRIVLSSEPISLRVGCATEWHGYLAGRREPADFNLWRFDTPTHPRDRERCHDFCFDCVQYWTLSVQQAANRHAGRHGLRLRNSGHGNR